MQYFTHVALGFLMAFLSLIPPGMLNMTALRTKLEKSKKEAILFSLGAAIIIVAQVYIALAFTKYFAKNPQIIERLTLAGTIVLFSLSVIFFIQARKKFKGEGKKKQGNYFLLGMFMSSMNMLSIPFYLFLSAFLKNKELLILQQPYINFFVSGTFLGSFTLFYIYIAFAAFIEKRAQFIARNINYILSALFFVLGILTLIKMLK
jgi:threonine/homoserine/homoserine lactone efflux protein